MGGKSESAGMTGTRESSTAGGRPTPEVDTFDPATDGPNSSDFRKAEKDLQADDDARRDRVRAEEAEAAEEAQKRAAEISNEVKRPEDFLPEDKVRPAETDAERHAQEHSNDDRSKSVKK